MFDIRRKNKYNALLASLVSNFLTQESFERLKQNQPEFWEFPGARTLEILKTQKFRWNKKSLIIGIQDVLDALAGRKTRKLHGKKQVNKDPYIYDLMRCFEIGSSHNRPRGQLESMINKKIRELSVSAKG